MNGRVSEEDRKIEAECVCNYCGDCDRNRQHKCLIASRTKKNKETKDCS